MIDPSQPSWSIRIYLVRILILALAYAGAGHIALLLALPPGYATAIFPSSGIALAAVSVFGAPILPGVAIGSLTLNLITGWQSEQAITAAGALGALGVAAASTLQAWVGCLLLRRLVRPELDSGRDVLGYLALAPAICLVSASISVPALTLLGVMPGAAAALNWTVWWVGDAIGVLLGAPLTWIAIGRPRRLWWRRRWLLSLPLAVSSAVFIAIYVNVSRWEQDQQLLNFRLQAEQAGQLLQSKFQEHERILYTLSRLVALRPQMLPAEFNEMARSYLGELPDLRAMAWYPRVAAAEREAFEEWAQQQIAPDYEIREIAADGKLAPAGARPVYFPVTLVEPKAMTLSALGLDIGAESVRADAVRRALASDHPSASAPLDLIVLDQHKKGLLLTQAVRLASGQGAEPAGILGMAIQIDSYLAHTLGHARLPGYQVRLVDITAGDAGQILIDSLARTAHAPAFERRLAFGQRHYQLSLTPANGYLARHSRWQSWITLAGGLTLTGLLGAFLLLLSGQRLRMESVVEARTRELKEREAKLAAILDKAVDAILTIGRDGRVVSVNRAAGPLFGQALEVLPGLPLERLVRSPDGGDVMQVLERLSRAARADDVLTGRYADGRDFPLSLAASLVEVGNEIFYVCILRDLTEQQRAQDKIFQLAHHDSLTGLANRFTLSTRLNGMLREADSGGESLALMFIDLDYFKKINDTLGHHTGDQLLVQASQRLAQLLPQAAIAARLANDEFIVVLRNPNGVEELAALARAIIDTLREPFVVNGQRLQSGASVGISRFPGDGLDADTLLRNADAAVLAAKQQGRGKFQFFTAELNAAAQERLQMENRIWQGLEKRQFQLYFQPQIHLASREIIGAEVLLRWPHPELGFIAPDRFIPIAEETGLILPLGEWVLEQSLRQLADWQRRGLPALRLAVNVSARQCLSGTLIACLDRLQAETGVNLHWLEMEITETAAMQDPEQTRQLLRELRRRGIKVAIDDFGTGYSSLSYLKLFEIDRIKIDRSFVKDIENDENDALIASATIGLAHTLGLEVLAEGIESESQCAFLNHELCDEGQGYLFGKPMPVADFERLLDTTGRRGLVCYA